MGKQGTGSSGTKSTGSKAEKAAARAAARAARSPREKWVRRVLWWGVLPLTLYTLFGFFGVPLLIRHVGIPQLNKRIQGTASLTKAACNPFKFAVRLEDFGVVDAAGKRVAGFKKFEGGFLLWDTLFKSGWHFDRALVDAPEVRAELETDGKFNLVKLVKPAPATDKPAEPIKRIPRLVVHRLGVSGADVGFVDRTLATPFETEWKDLTFDLNELDTRPDNQNPHSMKAVSAAGESVEWKGSFFVNPLTSSGTVTVKDIDLSRLMPYLEGKTEGKLTAGKLSAVVEYEFAPLSEQRVVKGKVVTGGIAGLKVELGGREVVGAELAEITNAIIDADTRRVSIGEVQIRGGQLAVEREKSGLVSLTRLIPKGTDLGAAAAGEKRVDPRSIPYPIQQVSTAVQQLATDLMGAWDLGVEKLVVESSALAVQESSGERPVAYTFEKIKLVAGPVRTSEHYKLPFDVGLAAKEGGTLQATGTLEPFDRRAKIAVKAAGFNLTPAGGFLPEKLPDPLPPMRLASALVDLDGDFAVDLSNEAASKLGWGGSVVLASARLDPPGGGTAVAGIERVSLKGDAEVGLVKLNATSLSWSGQVEATGASVSTPVAELTRFNAARLAADGKAGVSLAESATTISWEGKADLGGLDAEAKVAGPVGVKIGTGASAGKLSLSIPNAGESTITFEGSGDTTGFALDAPEQFKAKVALGKGSVEGVKLDTAGKLIELANVTAEGPELSAAFPMLPPPGEGKAKKKDTSEKAAGGFVNPVYTLTQKVGWQAKVGEAKVTGGKIRVADDAAPAPGQAAAELTVEEIEVAAKGLSTDGQTIADLAISSKVQSSGSFKFTGKLDAFREQPVADVQVTVSAVPAKPFDPFVGRYVGYLVDRGRVNSTIPIKIENGSLTGKLDFSLDQFHLGDGTKSPDAPDVPIKLGLDLLRDGNDKVAGKIPLSGKLSDPSFSIVGLVWDAFFNLIFKAATAPFQILGSLFGAAEGQDLSMVAFQPGSAELAPDAVSTIDILAKAMKERPAIVMVAGGRYNVEADTPGMKKVILREQMLKRVQVGTPYIEKLDDKLYKTAVEAEWKEFERAKAKDGAAPEREGGPVPFEQMEKGLLERVEVPVERFAELAKKRAEAVVAVMVKDNGVPAERVKVGEDAAEKLVGDKPKVDLGVK